MAGFVGVLAMVTTTALAEPALRGSDEDLVYVVHNVHTWAVAFAREGHRAMNPRLRAFGRRLVREHEAADLRLVTFARRRGVPAGTLDDRGRHATREDEAELRGLRQAAGDELDARFLEVTLKHLERWLTLSELAAARARDPVLARLLERVRPLLERQLRLGENLRPEAS